MFSEDNKMCWPRTSSQNVSKLPLQLMKLCTVAKTFYYGEMVLVDSQICVLVKMLYRKDSKPVSFGLCTRFRHICCDVIELVDVMGRVR